LPKIGIKISRFCAIKPSWPWRGLHGKAGYGQAEVAQQRAPRRSPSADQRGVEGERGTAEAGGGEPGAVTAADGRGRTPPTNPIEAERSKAEDQEFIAQRLRNAVEALTTHHLAAVKHEERERGSLKSTASPCFWLSAECHKIEGRVFESD
jgi:hypothetical protein